MGLIVYSYYVLDIVHRGHILMMKNSKALAGKDGKLIVGILTDEATMEKKPRPILNFNERMALAEAIKYADLVIPQTTYSPMENIMRIKPDIHMESTSHSEEDIKELEEVVKKWGGRIISLPYYPEVSSTDIKKEIINKNKE